MKTVDAIARITAAREQLGNRPEKLHLALDEILLECVPNSVAAAYNEAVKTADWWTHG